MRCTLINTAMMLESANPTKSVKELVCFLEDGESPVVRKMHETLYNEVIDKKHIDFGDIPESKGNLKSYSGYKTMTDIISIMKSLVATSKDALYLVNIVETAVLNIVSLAPVFKQGFDTKNDLVMLEYNTHTYTCVEATTSLINEFVDYIKRPEDKIIQLKFKDTKYRANNLFISNLEKFNAVVKTGDYKKYLTSMMQPEKSGFVGLSTVIGAATLATIGMAIVPLTREIVFQVYNTRRKLSDRLAYQAYLIEMNKLQLEGNKSINANKRADIIKKQEAIKLKMLRLADALKVDSITATEKSKRQLSEKSSLLNIDNIKKEIEDSPLELL